MFYACKEGSFFNFTPLKMSKELIIFTTKRRLRSSKRKRKTSSPFNTCSKLKPFFDISMHIFYVLNIRFFFFFLRFCFLSSDPPPLHLPSPTLSSKSILKKAHHIWWVSVSVYQNDIANLSSRSECFDSNTYFHA